MKKILKKAPLVHTVIHLEISRCPALKLSDPQIEDAIQSRMIDLGFQDYIRSEHRVLEISAQFNPDNQTASPKEVITPRRVFRSASQRELVEVSENAIILKTADYSTFEELHDEYFEILTAFLEVVDQTKKVLIKRIGLRYVDVIAPAPGSKLSDYIQEGMLPARLEMLPGARKLQGLMMSRSQTAPGSEMTVGFEEISPQEGQVRKVLPNNLLEPDNNCTLKIAGQTWWAHMDADTYGILDIDHVHFFKDNPAMSLELVKEKLSSLYSATSNVFWSSITATAKSEWGETQIEEDKKNDMVVRTTSTNQ